MQWWRPDGWLAGVRRGEGCEHEGIARGRFLGGEGTFFILILTQICVPFKIH